MTNPSERLKIKFRARVIAGAGLGKKFGFPTANLDVSPEQLGAGVYAARIMVRKKAYWGLLHCGARETVGLQPSVEVWIEDFDGNVYGEILEVEAVQRVRGVQTFSSIDALQEAIATDVTVLQSIKDVNASAHENA